jgi:hypothetical protein
MTRPVSELTLREIDEDRHHRAIVSAAGAGGTRVVIVSRNNGPRR